MLSALKMNNKSQTWSMDVMIAVVVFILGLFVFFTIIENKSDSGKLRELIVEGEQLANIIEISAESDNPCSFIVDNKIDKEKLAECANNYNRTKTLLGAKRDFCIYFEDSKGNIINISFLTGHGGIGFGDPSVTYSIYDEDGDVVDIIKCGANLTTS